MKYTEKNDPENGTDSPVMGALEGEQREWGIEKYTKK